ncbi:hypothetical protein PFICI_06049 [Pestalotiopsis fici W106-1]|uniref:Uncharacterized protein n=1 Tax=Pestalotiopsis fici (strain W106-1 / CGMCC3.15140) TaxID=1229662 RepID=W3X6L7_PESFW|nr:uncharacterized protein PFICI_06049 [Pestalotiopsis fici W106-1]ETS81047.1 hypothetical protein PFICI_06049 [Pestalotiopsis fici W106-1]
MRIYRAPFLHFGVPLFTIELTIYADQILPPPPYAQVPQLRRRRCTFSTYHQEFKPLAANSSAVILRRHRPTIQYNNLSLRPGPHPGESSAHRHLGLSDAFSSFLDRNYDRIASGHTIHGFMTNNCTARGIYTPLNCTPPSDDSSPGDSLTHRDIT